MQLQYHIAGLGKFPKVALISLPISTLDYFIKRNVYKFTEWVTISQKISSSEKNVPNPATLAVVVTEHVVHTVTAPN